MKLKSPSGFMNKPKVENSVRPSDLHVYSANCSWSGSISSVGLLPTPPLTIKKRDGTEVEVPGMSLPCCPHCKSVLFQIEEERWLAGIPEHEAKGHTNYGDFITWKEAQKRCWPSLREAAFAYEQETGREVILGQ